MIALGDQAVPEAAAMEEEAAASLNDTPEDNTDAVDAANYSYQPVVWHWFYLKEIDKTRKIW